MTDFKASSEIQLFLASRTQGITDLPQIVVTNQPYIFQNECTIPLFREVSFLHVDILEKPFKAPKNNGIHLNNEN